MIDWHARFLQQAGWTRQLREYAFKCAGLKNARRVLEVGCGTGAILADVVSQASSVHGLDREAGRLAEARRRVPAARLTCGEAGALPYPEQVFDITFCHFLLLWVPDPLQALMEMKRVTRPGGYVLALAEPDYTARVDKPEALAPLGRWQAEALRTQGADPGLGCRLAGLYRQTGIRILETGSLQGWGEHPATRGERDQEWAVLQADLAGFVPAEELSKLRILDEQAWALGERVLYVPTYYAIGTV